MRVVGDIIKFIFKVGLEFFKFVVCIIISMVATVFDQLPD